MRKQLYAASFFIHRCAMSTVTGNSVPLTRLQELAADPVAANEHLVAVVLTLLDADEEVRAWASDVLAGIEEPNTAYAPQLAELTRHVNAPVAGWACKLLGRMADTATPYQDALRRTLTTHAEISVRQLAALALQTVPNLNQETCNALREAASSDDSRLSRLAKEALQNE